MQPQTDLGQAFSRGDQAKHLELALREPLVQRASGSRVELAGKPLGHGGGNVFAALGSPANGLDQRGGIHIFREIARCTELERAHGKNFFGVHAEHQDRKLGLLGLDHLEQFKAGFVGQRHVREHQVERGMANDSDRRCCISGRSHHVDVAGFMQHGAQTLQHHGMVVDDQDAQLKG